MSETAPGNEGQEAWKVDAAAVDAHAAGAGVSSAAGAANVAPAALLAALSRAFTYPWNGIAETTSTLRALDAASLGETLAERVRALLETSETFEDRTAEQLAYTRLFIGSFKMEAPPYASFYLEEGHTLNGQAAAEVEAVYAQFGLELDSKEIAPPDHLRYLLSFLALLAARYEESGAAAFAEAYADFHAEYVFTWIDQFQELVNRYAEHPYYPELVALIVDVLNDKGAGSTAPEGE